MGSGKSVEGAQIVLYELARMLMMNNPQERFNLGPNTEITFGNIANSLTQAQKTVFRKSVELVANSPFLYSHMKDINATMIKFPKSLTVEALGSNLGSAVGRRMKVFVADEIDDYDDPDDVYFKLSKSGGHFLKWNENTRVMIGSPQFEGGFLVTTYRKAQKEQWPNTKLLWTTSSQLNPEMDEATLEKERMKDPERFARDYLAEPISAKENLFNPILLSEVENRCKSIRNLFIGEPVFYSKEAFVPEIDHTMLKVAPDAIDYIITADPSVLHDAFGLSIGYLSTYGGHKVIGSTIFKANKNEEINTENIKEILKTLLEVFPVRYYIYDVYLHTDIRDMVSRYGVMSIQHNLNLNDWIYTRNDLYNDELSVPWSKYLFKEFRELFIIKNKKIDHPRNGSKDQADTVAQFDSFIRRLQEEDRNQVRDSNSLTHMVASF
jgi:hypothetical protein